MADINIYSIGSKMLICCLKGNLEYCQYLYHHGYQNDISRPNINLRTPLTVACSMGHLHISKWLYEKGAHNDIDKKDKNGAYPGYCAIREGNFETVQWLYSINKLDNIWQSDNVNKLPLWFVCNRTLISLDKRLEIAKFLIVNGVKTQRTSEPEKDFCYIHIWDICHQDDFEDAIIKWATKQENEFYHLKYLISEIRGSNQVSNLDSFIILEIMNFIDENFNTKKIDNIIKLIEYHKKKK